MKKLKPWQITTPIENHCCEAMEHCNTVSISKRHIDGQDRWMWEQTQKNEHIAANEIMFCPYCGVELNHCTKPENISEKEQAIIQQAMKEIKKYHCGDYDCLLPESKINDEGYWANDEACNACTYGACYRVLKCSLIQKIRTKEE